MHETEALGSMWRRLAVPGGWVYWSAGEQDDVHVPDDWADHVVAYRREQAKRHGLPLPAYLQPADPDPRAPILAELAVALELDPGVGFETVLARAREAVAAVKRLEAGAAAWEEVES